MAKKIIGILILAILIGFGAYYGTKVLGVNPIENNLAGISPVIDRNNGKMYYGIEGYFEWDELFPSDPCFKEKQKLAGIKTQIQQVTQKINDVSRRTPQTDDTRNELKRHRASLSRLDDAKILAQEELDRCLKRNNSKK